MPEGAVFKGYNSWVTQDIELKTRVIEFKCAKYKLPDGTYVTASLPRGYEGMHFGPQLRAYIVSLHHQTNIPQNKIHELLTSLGIQISTGEIDRILNVEAANLKPEADAVFETGMKTAEEIRMDDTSNRHKGENQYTVAVGNPFFAAFRPAESKSRESILRILQGNQPGFAFNNHALDYLTLRKANDKIQAAACMLDRIECNDDSGWLAALHWAGINPISMGKNGLKLLTEAALMGHLVTSRVSPNIALTSDGAGQFLLFLYHQLCWIHAVRILERLVPVSDAERKQHESLMSELWDFYDQLKIYKKDRAQQTPQRKHELIQLFEQRFERRLGMPDLLLPSLRLFCSHKTQLLLVLDHPYVAIHNNSSEQDIRTFVIKRKISGGTRSDAGREARHNMATLSKTCKKLGMNFWNFLVDRITGANIIDSLADIIAARAAASPP